MRKVKYLEDEIDFLRNRIAGLEVRMVESQKSSKNSWLDYWKQHKFEQIELLQNEVLVLKDILRAAGIIQEADVTITIKDNKGDDIPVKVNQVFATPDNEDTDEDFFDLCSDGCC